MMRGLRSFGEPVDALVVGANGGLGRAFVGALLEDDGVRSVHAWSRSAIARDHAKLAARRLETYDEAEVAGAVAQIERLSLVIVATGVLHDPASGLSPEKSSRAISANAMAESFHINAILPAVVAKHTLGRLPRRGKALFCALSARVGSIADNRMGGWYSYRASKAALNQIITCLSIEIGRTHPEAVCIGLHPGTVDTGLSKPFQSSLASGHRLFAPAEAVSHLLHVIDGASPERSGAVLAWDGTAVPA